MRHTIPITTKNKTITPKYNNAGLKTNHHDHVIRFIILATTKIIVKTTAKNFINISIKKELVLQLTLQFLNCYVLMPCFTGYPSYSKVWNRTTPQPLSRPALAT